MFNRVKLPGVIFVGKWLSVMPDWDLPIAILCGSPMSFPGGRVTPAQVDASHKEYIARIQRLYEKHGHMNGKCKLVLY
jgi:hypothetical protein